MAYLKCKCGCEEFRQTDIYVGVWKITKDGDFEEQSHDFLESDSNLVCEECGAEYYYDGESLIEFGGEK